MNRPMPPGDRGCGDATALRASGRRRALPRARRLVDRAAAVAKRAQCWPLLRHGWPTFAGAAPDWPYGPGFRDVAPVRRRIPLYGEGEEKRRSVARRRAT